MTTTANLSTKITWLKDFSFFFPSFPPRLILVKCKVSQYPESLDDCDCDWSQARLLKRDFRIDVDWLMFLGFFCLFLKPSMVRLLTISATCLPSHELDSCLRSSNWALLLVPESRPINKGDHAGSVCSVKSIPPSFIYPLLCLTFGERRGYTMGKSSAQSSFKSLLTTQFNHSFYCKTKHSNFDSI